LKDRDAGAAVGQGGRRKVEGILKVQKTKNSLPITLVSVFETMPTQK